MLVCAGCGLLLTAALAWFAHHIYDDCGGLAWPHLPLSVGLLIAQVILWTGVITLLTGRLTLVLDKTLGTGDYRVCSPIVDAGEPCTFKLEDIHTLAIETQTEERPGAADHSLHEVTVHRLRLRLNRPRRAITLDETENNRTARLEELADRVAAFLGTKPVRVDHAEN
jgi:hypothetical protein